MNEKVYLGLSILELGKIVMYKFWCDVIPLKTKIKLYQYKLFHCLHKNK